MTTIIRLGDVPMFAASAHRDGGFMDMHHHTSTEIVSRNGGRR